MATTMTAIQTNGSGSFTSVQRDIPQPGPGSVRIRVQACGICHSDAFVRDGQWPGLEFPRVPGHEVAGVIDAVGEGIDSWKPGERVGIGWCGRHCTYCTPCRRGDFSMCENLRITGFNFDGGYEQYMIAPERGLARIPDALTAAEAGPLMCAGVTTFNSLRHSGAAPGDLVAVQGIGGLGHLGIQFARAFGYHTVALSNGADKEALALKLGAHKYLDASAVNVADELKKLGGARVILATAPSAAAMTSAIGGLGIDGKLLVVGAAFEPLQVPAIQLIGGRRSVQGWASGTARDSEDTLNFCALHGVRPMIETFPLADVAAAFERMITNKARFRVVLTTD